MTTLSSSSLDIASAVFDHLRLRCHRRGGQLSLADLDAAEHAFRLGLTPEVDVLAPQAAQLPFDAAGLLAMLLCAHTSDLATRAFATRRNASDRTWIKQFFRALAEFLVEHYDSAFPARAAAAYAEATRAHGRPVSGVTLMSSAAGRAAARYSLAPLIEGAPMPPATVAAFCARVNAALRYGTGSSPPLHVGLAEVERFLALVRQTPRLRGWLAAAQEPPEPAGLDDCIDLDDMPALLAAAPLLAL